MGFNCKIVSIWELEQNSSWVVIIEIIGFYHLVYWSLSVYNPLWELKSEPTRRTGPQELLEIARMLILPTATVDFGHQDSRCSWGLHLTTNEHVFLMVFPHRDCLISSQNVKLIHPCAVFPAQWAASWIGSAKRYLEPSKIRWRLHRKQYLAIPGAVTWAFVRGLCTTQTYSLHVLFNFWGSTPIITG